MKLILLLIFLQIIWASTYAAMKIALGAMPVGLVMILRYGIATLCFLAIGAFRRPSFSRWEWLAIVGIGILNYSGSPFFQLKSLTMTYAMDLAVLVSTEPLVTALIASLVLKERITWDMAAVFVVATAGVLVLSGVGGTTLAAPATSLRLCGNLLFLAALVAEAVNSTAGRKLTQTHRPLQVVAWMMASGTFSNLLLNFGDLSEMPPIRESAGAWVSIVYLALFATAFAYSMWYKLLQRIEVSPLALSLFLQPVAGIFWAMLLLGERPDLRTVIGGGVIVLTLFFWVLKTYSKKTTERAEVL